MIVGETRIFTINLKVDDYKIENIAQVMYDYVHIEKKYIIFLLRRIEKLPVGVVDSILSLTQSKIIKKWGERKLSDKGILCKIKDVCVRKNENKEIHLHITVEWTYSEILCFAREKLEKSRNKEICSVGLPIIQIMDEDVPNEIKDKIIVKIVGALNEKICFLFERLLRQKYNLNLSLSGMEVLIQKKEQVSNQKRR